MTIASRTSHTGLHSALLLGAVLAGIPAHAAWAQQQTSHATTPTVVIAQPTPQQNFQQAVQQQQVRDQLQQSQLEAKLHQSVSDATGRPSANDPLLQKQLQQADEANRQRDRAIQQDLLDRYQHALVPPPVKSSQPASSRSGG